MGRIKRVEKFLREKLESKEMPKGDLIRRLHRFDGEEAYDVIKLKRKYFVIHKEFTHIRAEARTKKEALKLADEKLQRYLKTI